MRDLGSLFTLAAVAGAIAAGYYFAGGDAGPETETPAGRLTSPGVMAYPKEGFAAATATTPVATFPRPPERPPAPSVGAKIDAYLAAGTPEDLFQAYILARDCVAARATNLAACPDVDPGTLSSRQGWLLQAAEAGVHGASYAYAWDLADSHTPTAEEALEIERLDEIAVAHKDPLALQAWAIRARDLGQPEDALRWWLAFGEAGGNKTPRYGEVLTQLRKEAGK